MDSAHFDALARRCVDRTARRAALRLLAGGVLGGLAARRSSLLARAQRLDSDQDGLFDDDETNVYGTRPDLFDTDGDNVGDGEEVYNRDNGLGGPSDPLTPDGGAAAPAAACAALGAACATDDTCCVGYCGQDAICACISDSYLCYPSGYGGCCSGQPCNDSGFCGACRPVGAACNSDVDCCQNNGVISCCFSGVSLSTVCTDVTNTGYVCPGDAPPPAGCPAGQTACGGTCADLSSHAGHCGACFASCALGGICRGGACGVACTDGQTDCGGFCVDLQTDFYHCGACGRSCGDPALPVDCITGSCLDVSEAPAAPGGGGDDIDDVENKTDPCAPRGADHPNDVCMDTGEESEDDQ